MSTLMILKPSDKEPTYRKRFVCRSVSCYNKCHDQRPDEKLVCRQIITYMATSKAEHKSSMSGFFLWFFMLPSQVRPTRYFTLALVAFFSYYCHFFFVSYRVLFFQRNSASRFFIWYFFPSNRNGSVKKDNGECHNERLTETIDPVSLSVSFHSHHYRYHHQKRVIYQNVQPVFKIM